MVKHVEINHKMHAMNDGLYDVPQVAWALLRIHAKVSPLVCLIRVLALDLILTLQ